MTKPIDIFIRESYAIEGVEFLELGLENCTRIVRAHEVFLHRDPLSIDSLVAFVKAAAAPEVMLRTTPGMNVQVAGHRPMPGGEQVKHALVALLERANMDKRPKQVVAFDYYWQYLYLHPFSNYNGRSARALWAKLMGGIPEEMFLARFHYQSLMWQDANRPVEHRPVSPSFNTSEDAGDAPLG